MEAEDLEKELKQYVERVVEAFSTLISTNEYHPFLPIPDQEAFLHNLTQNMRSIFKRLEVGTHALLSLIVELARDENSTLSKEHIDQLGQLVAVATVVKEHSGRFTQEMAEGKSLKDIFGVNDETIELLYSGTKYLFDNQHYFEASSAFAILTLLDPSSHLFWMGLGTSEYLQGRYEAALLAYAMAAQADSSDALCHVYGAHCYLALKQPDRAIHSLEIAALVADSSNDEQKLKHKIINQLHELKRGEA